MKPDASPGSGVVIITGASRGLGLGLACLLAERHVPLLITARNESLIGSISAALRTVGSPVAGVAADAADEAAMDQAFRVAASLGPLQSVVNNAGVLEPIDPIAQVDTSAFDRHFRTNVTGVMIGTKLALRFREPSTVLRVVNVSSGAASSPYAGWSAYCASKAAITMLTQVAALENQDGRTSIVSVAPGIVETAMQQTIRSMPTSRFPQVQRFVQFKESGSLLDPVDAAMALEWLARGSPLALSGQMVDGRAPDTRGAIERYYADSGEPIAATLQRAKRMYEKLQGS